MNLKKGGGNHLQPYDIRNGRYTDNDKMYYVLKKFPEFGYTSEFYPSIFIRKIARMKEFYVEDTKILNYLLVPQADGDKMGWFKLLGYTRNQADFDYIKQQLQRTEFCDLDDFTINKFGIFIRAKTIFKNKNSGLYYSCTSVWEISEKDYRPRFVTLIPGNYEERHRRK